MSEPKTYPLNLTRGQIAALASHGSGGVTRLARAALEKIDAAELQDRRLVEFDQAISDDLYAYKSGDKGWCIARRVSASGNPVRSSFVASNLTEAQAVLFAAAGKLYAAESCSLASLRDQVRKACTE